MREDKRRELGTYFSLCSCNLVALRYQSKQYLYTIIRMRLLTVSCSSLALPHSRLGAIGSAFVLCIPRFHLSCTLLPFLYSSSRFFNTLSFSSLRVIEHKVATGNSVDLIFSEQSKGGEK